MKILTLYHLVWYTATCHFLSFFLIFLTMQMDGAFGRSDMKTKLLLQNIRTHLAQKADEIVKEKECESGLILCKSPKGKEDEAEDERSEEIRPPPKLIRGQHKPLIRVKPKDVIQTFMPKVHKSPYRKFQKGGENEKNLKFLKAPTKYASEEEVSDEDRSFVQKIVQQSVKSEHKLREGIHTKSLKFEKKDEKPAAQSDRKIIKKKIKIDEAKSPPKNNEPLMEENKKINLSKGEKKSELKTDKQDAVEETLVFSSGAFVFALDSDNSQRNICEKHTQIYEKQLKKYEIWALMMHDASAKLPSSIFQGNTNQYGDFDQCLSINAVFKKSKKKLKDFPGIKGKYCLANIDLRTVPESSKLHKLQERIESFRFIKSTIHDPAHFIPRFSTMNWGLCVPSECLAEDVEKFLKSKFESFHKISGLAFDVKVEEDNCVVKDDLKFKYRAETLIAILFYLSVLIISIFATCLDARPKNNKINKGAAEEISTDDDFKTSESSKKSSFKEKGKNIIMAFSLKKNLKKLLSDNNKGSIECINGIKSIFTVLLYFAHKTIPLGMTPFSNRIFLTKISNQPATVLLRASIVYTDSFLLISGILTAYSLAKEISEKKEISWLRKSIARFIRLTPPLLAVVLFYAYVWDQLNSGPTWNLVVKRNSLLCRWYMWRNLLYIQNLFEFENMCAPQTHQLALDMQLSLLAPLFVYLMQTYDKLGIGILQALFFLSSVLRYTTTSRNNLSVVIYHGMSVTQLYETANLLYSQAIYRASPYILGTVVGYHLNKFEKQVSIPKALAALGWATALIFGYYSLVSPFRLASRTYQYDVQEAAQYAALSPIAWSLALSWIIVACHLGFGGKVNQFLCKKIFVVFSRISYSVYLTQFLVFFYMIGVKRIPERFTFAGSFSIYEFVIVIGVSIIVTLFFDIPMTEIKKILLDKKTTKSISESSTSESSGFKKSVQKEIEKESQIILDESLGETTDALITAKKHEEEDVEEDEGNSAEDDPQEESDENANEETDEELDEEIDEEDNNEVDEEMIEAVFEIRPLRRSMRMHFDDESDNKECFEIETKKGDDNI